VASALERFWEAGVTQTVVRNDSGIEHELYAFLRPAEKDWVKIGAHFLQCLPVMQRRFHHLHFVAVA
jgi:hypothetical protein